MTVKIALKHSEPAAKAPAKKAQPARKSTSAVVGKKVVAAKKAAPAKKDATHRTGLRVSVGVAPGGFKVFGTSLQPKHRTTAEIAAAVAALD